jgi:hypothetical protein
VANWHTARVLSVANWPTARALVWLIGMLLEH